MTMSVMGPTLGRTTDSPLGLARRLWITACSTLQSRT
jgi:hypothetical protein